ncbi:MAG TPA: hypothetical protein VEA99_11570 [Gemmatimonadaceae bacterium]|nr:hypothetical protein [Gemmatimonadaceae bacterium]
MALREFTDRAGRAWRAWDVYPGIARTASLSVREGYRDGWLAFACGTETRRIAPVPLGWTALDEDGLERLCDDAMRSPGTNRPTA